MDQRIVPGEVTILDLVFRLPSVNQWQRLHWTERRKLKETAYLALVEAVRRAKLSNLPVPCLIESFVHLRDRRQRDPQNYLTPLDKLFIDALCPPRYTPPRRRGKGYHKPGLGLIPDDRPEFVALAVPQIILGAPYDHVVLKFIPKGGHYAHDNSQTLRS